MEQLRIATKSKQYPLSPSSILIISDEAVAPKHLPKVQQTLDSSWNVHSFIVPSGEQEKSFENYYAIQTYALEQGLDRDAWCSFYTDPDNLACP
jgi:3-dehydroquinate synthase